MKTITLLLALMIVCVTVPTFAQTSDAPAAQPPAAQTDNLFEMKDLWAVGLHAGLLSGSGVSVRYHPKGRLGTQFVIGAFKADKLLTYTFGAEGQFDFDTDGRTRFYGYLGLGYYYFDDVDKGKSKLDAPLRMGIGIAYEWAVSTKLIFMANGGITYFTDGTILPLPQIGLHYYFN